MAGWPRHYAHRPPPSYHRINWGHPLAHGLIGYWDFTRGNGTVIQPPRPSGAWDGTGLNGYLVNGAVWGKGAGGVGLLFDQGGSHPGMDLTSGGSGRGTPNPLRVNVFTIQILAQQTDTNAKKLLGISPAGEGTGVTIQWVPTPFQVPEGLRFHVEGNTVQIPWSNYGDNKVHVFTLTYDGATIRAHADLVDGTTSWSGTVTWDKVVTLGNLSADVGANQPWTGAVYGMRWWNRALRRSEIRELWARPYAFLVGPEPYIIGTSVPQISPTSLGSAVAFGTPVVNSLDLIEPTSLGSAVAFGTPAVYRAISPDSLGSAVDFGLPEVRYAGKVFPDSLASAADFGRPSLASPLQPAPYTLPLTFPNECVGVLREEACLKRGGIVFPLSLASAAAFGEPVLVGA